MGLSVVILLPFVWGDVLLYTYMVLYTYSCCRVICCYTLTLRVICCYTLSLSVICCDTLSLGWGDILLYT